jgi:hypothetical protein
MKFSTIAATLALFVTAGAQAQVSRPPRPFPPVSQPPIVITQPPVQNPFMELRNRLRLCNTYDVVCVGGILIDTIEYAANSGNQGTYPIAPQRTVQFFTTNLCNMNFYYGEVRLSGNYAMDAQLCKDKATAMGDTFIGSVRITTTTPGTQPVSTCQSYQGNVRLSQACAGAI